MSELASISGHKFSALDIPQSVWIENIDFDERSVMRNHQLVVKSKETHSVYGLNMLGFNLKHAIKRAKMQVGDEYIVYPQTQSFS